LRILAVTFTRPLIPALLEPVLMTGLITAIIFANAGGPPGEGYAGLSQVCVPYAGALTRLGSAAEGMAVVDLDMKLVEDAEANYQVRADLARSDWHYEYRHNSTSR
jgi:predicted amidohydrolase